VTKIRLITKYYKLAGMTCHLIIKAVMKQNCVEALNQYYYYYYYHRHFQLVYTYKYGQQATDTTAVSYSQRDEKQDRPNSSVSASRIFLNKSS